MKEFVCLKRVRTCIMTVLLLLTLTVATSCTASQTQMLEGILQNVDAVNGKITVVTKDGRVMTINIDQGTSVQTQEREFFS
ncbi:MAG: hypothetical protein PHU08_04570 [Dehalococcoidales bacterium]|nr:hypothetical protein [Dehalococcoidales bacterium]